MCSQKRGDFLISNLGERKTKKSFINGLDNLSTEHLVPLWD